VALYWIFASLRPLFPTWRSAIPIHSQRNVLIKIKPWFVSYIKSIFALLYSVNFQDNCVDLSAGEGPRSCGNDSLALFALAAVHPRQSLMFLPVLGGRCFFTYSLGRLDDLEAFGGRGVGGRTRSSGGWRNRVRLCDGRHRRVLRHCDST